MIEKNKNNPLASNFLDIESLSVQDIDAILEKAAQLKEEKSIPRTLEGKIILALFFENSTRTRTSFELAAKRLGADVVNWNVNTSSVNKGETFEDTIANLNALGAEATIMRHYDDDSAHRAATIMHTPVINAGAGKRHHPTQALLDAMTIVERKGSLNGLTIALCGDLKHSRVAASNIDLLSKYDVKIHAIAPQELKLAKDYEHLDSIKHFSTLEEGLPGCDVVMMHRIQKERMDQILYSDTTYFKDYGLTKDRLSYASPDALVMHPGPVNRQVELADDVTDGPQSVILEQVKNGPFIRMAVLDRVLGDH